jgi:diguanylate cyclase (GGDEF)-like protein
VAAFLLGTSAFALDPQRALTQSRLAVWVTDSGLPQNSINTIVQTRDGYLWIGTEEGLARFDGLRFTAFDRQNAPALRTPFISGLFEARDGTLWIGTYGGGLARLRNGRVEAFQPQILGSDRMRGMHESAQGVLSIATAGGGLLRIDGEKVTRFTTRDGLPTDRIWTLEDDGAGGLWIATHGGGVVRWRDGRVLQRLTTREGLSNDYARALLRDPDGTLWIGTDGGGVHAWRNGAIVHAITTRDGLPSNLIRALHRDRDGSLWIGTDAGLARWRGGRAEAFGVAEGLPSAIVRSLFEDREGSLWVGTTGGLVRLTDTRFLPYTRKEGLPVDAVRALLEDRQGRVWAGTEGGGLCSILPAWSAGVPPAGPQASRLRLGTAALQCFTKADGLPHDAVYALAESGDGSLWVGTDGGGVARLRDGKFVETIAAQLPTLRVRSLVEAPDGALWISTTSGLAHVRGGTVTRVPELEDRQLRPLLLLPNGELLVGTDGAGLWRVRGAPASSPAGSRASRLRRRDAASPAAGTAAFPATLIANAGRELQSDRVFSLVLDADRKHVWIGTSGGGLSRLDLETGGIRTLTRRDGLHDDVVFQIVDSGDLWMTSNRGLYRVDRNRVLEAMRGAHGGLHGTVYGTSDGMPSSECNAASPAAMRTRDGRLWIATARGIAVVDPRVDRRNTVAPPVHIEEVLVDGVPVPRGALRIRPGTQRLEVRYTAVSLRAPERVHFRYMLDGYDTEWVSAGASRVAHYTKLAPGDYTFRVTAMNEDGVPSAGEARLPMRVDPRWYETWWARLLALALIAAAVWGAMRLRIAAMRARKNEELARAYEHVHRMAGELEDTNRQLAVANERLRALSYIDGLTGVANRRRFDEALADACAAANETGAPLSLILLDLDHFKRLNDSHGHQYGDEALRAIAAMLAKRTAARGGLVARVGGEEFAWLMPGVPLDAAKAEAEAFRVTVRDAAVRHDGAEQGIVTASLGVAAANGNGVAPADLVAAADAALYRAKASGRDRVEAEGMR